jgi:hypothetical protein
MGSQQTQQTSGGGLGGAIAGGLAGYGAGQGWGGGGNTNTTQGFNDTSRSQFGIQNLNSAYGFNTPQQVNFGSSSAFGQLGGGGQLKQQMNNFSQPVSTMPPWRQN